ncbi:hypothetical protein A5760_15460 [Mycobacterium colombiense]|uniref:Cytochrome P450 n=1 Tax=Mycobacterium colombiense TaxID=339268 RepID=A0A1A0VEN0_9MYCO|nr:hypothetical protein A5760_15460 [Mycobacterium colombiense]
MRMKNRELAGPIEWMPSTLINGIHSMRVQFTPGRPAALGREPDRAKKHALAANRDPAVYDDPDRLDISRVGAPAMQTFGAGMHYCLGANLARLELAEALAIMTRRMPNAHRTGPAPWKPLTGLSGPTTLPIEFDAVP